VISYAVRPVVRPLSPRSMHFMQAPQTDSSEYAALLESIGSVVRLPASVRAEDDTTRHPWAFRAKAMTQAFLAMAAASARPSP